jgi:hypothetical protein
VALIIPLGYNHTRIQRTINYGEFNDDLAELLFPEVTGTIAELEKRYPERHLPEGAEVTRFAPSPTGFLHTGSLFTSMIGYTIAKQSHGVFFSGSRIPIPNGRSKAVAIN